LPSCCSWQDGLAPTAFFFLSAHDLHSLITEKYRISNAFQANKKQRFFVYACVLDTFNRHWFSTFFMICNYDTKIYWNAI
jgi:predicted Zn-dependent peptidase